MFYPLIIFVTAVFLFIVFINRSSIISFIHSKNFLNRQTEYKNEDLINVLFGLENESLNELFKLYGKEFGRGAAYYARRTYLKWKSGKVRPSHQTFQRFLLRLPKVMSYDLKCEVLRKLMQEYCAKDFYELDVSKDDWEAKLTPLVQTIIEKTYTASLPQAVEEKLQWLTEADMQQAQNILKYSQVEEGKISVSMLRQEISDIENLVQNVKGNTTVRHELKLPYGKINLKIKSK